MNTRRGPSTRGRLFGPILTLAALAGFLTIQAAPPEASSPENKAPKPQLIAKRFGWNYAFAAFSPGMKYLTTYTRAGKDEPPSRIFLWNAEDGQFIATFEAYPTTRPLFAPDLKTFAYQGSDGSVKIWDLAEKKDIKKLGTGMPEVFSPDGRQIAISSETASEVWDLGSASLVTHCDYGHNCGTIGYSWTRDGRILAARIDGICCNVWIYDLLDCKGISGTTGYGNDSVTGGAFSPDGKYLAVSGGGTTLWEVSGGKSVRTWMAEEFHFLPDGKTIVICHRDESEFFYYRTGKLIKKVPRPCGLLTELYPIPVWIKEFSSGLDHKGIELHSALVADRYLTIMLYPDAWLIYDQNGFFDASPNAKAFLSWNDGSKTFPAEQFWDQNNRPGLLGSTLKDWTIRTNSK